MTNFIVVASHVRYHEPRARFLASFAWPDVIVTLNGSDGDRVVVGGGDGVTHLHMLTNIYEYSAFYAPLHVGTAEDKDNEDNAEDDAYLLVHDTCLAGPDFAARAVEAFEEFRRAGVDILWCSPTGQCNIAVYNRRAALVARAMWGTRTRLDKGHSIVMEHRPDCTDSLKSRQDLKQRYVGQPTYEVSRQPVYSSQHVRVGLRFPYLDVVKYYWPVESLDDVRHPDEP